MLGTYQAPAYHAAAERAAHLVAAEQHLDDAETAEREARALDVRVQELGEANRRDLRTEQKIRERAGKTSAAVTFRRGPLTRDADLLRSHIEERTTHIGQLRERKQELSAQAAELRKQARSDIAAATGSPAPRHIPLREQTERLRADLPDYISRQDDADRTRHDQLRAQTDRYWGEATEHGAQAAGLRDECALRNRLPADRTATESAERTQAARQAAERRRRAYEISQSYYPQPHRHLPPTPGRGGPGIGR